MIRNVTLPKLGQTVESATIERWMKAEGDPVAKGDVLCEITTDKATLEVESFYKGTLLKVVAPEGAELPVNALIAIIGDPGDEVPENLAAAPAPAGDPTPAPPPEEESADAPSAAERGAAAPPLPAGAKLVTLPKLGQTVEAGSVERWLKDVGDPVAKGDVLCEITTDKATLEVESFHKGTLLKILAEPGTELPVGAPIAVIGEAGSEIPDDLLAIGPAPAAPAARAEAATTPAMPTAEAPTAPPAEKAARHEGGRIFASPRARMRAREKGVDLATVAGRGPNGRIIEADVLAAEAAPAVRATPVARRAAEVHGADLAAVRGTGPGGKVTKADVLRHAVPPAPAALGAPGEIVPLTPMRRIVAERMLHSKQTIPCYYLEMDVDCTELVEVRARLNERAKKQDIKFSFNDFFIKACGGALAAYPQVNSRWADGGLERRTEANVGFAVAIEEGLMVPVVRKADAKSLNQINAEAADLAARARSKRLLPEEYQGGCMTITNLGMFGVKSFIPVVNPGESTIMGQGMIEDRVVCRQGGIQVRKMMTLTLACDHRIIDGAVGAQFLEAIRDMIEAPKQLIT